MPEHTIYIDVLFATNVIVDYFLLLITAKFSFSACSRWRFFCASLLGGLFSVVLFFWPYPSWLAPFMQAIVCLSICVVAFNKPHMRDLVRLSLILFACTLAFGGVIFALSYFCNPRGLFAVHSGVAYIDLPFMGLMLGACVAYALLGMVFGNGAMRAKAQTLEICAQAWGRKLEFSAMQDTGNLLKEPISGKKVIVLHKAMVMQIMPQELLEKIEEIGYHSAAQVLLQMEPQIARKFTLVPYVSVGQAGDLMLALRPDLLMINGEKSMDYILGISACEFNLGAKENAIINI